MRKKVLALVLALVMVVAMLPTVAFAAGEKGASDNPINTAAELVEFLGQGAKEENGVVKLTESITKNDASLVYFNGDITLDLCGQTLTIYVWAFRSGGAFTITDSGEEGKIISNSAQALHLAGGTLNIQGGTIESTAATSVIAQVGQLNMTGGKIINNNFDCLSVTGAATVDISGGTIEQTHGDTAVNVQKNTNNHTENAKVTIKDEANIISNGRTLQVQDGTVSITGGKLTQSEGATGSAVIICGGNTTISGGEIIGTAEGSLTDSKMAYPTVQVGDPGGDGGRPGKLEVTGGEIKATGTNSFGLYAYQNGTTVTISGEAKISGTETGVQAGTKANVTISSGTIEGRYAAGAGDGGKLTVDHRHRRYYLRRHSRRLPACWQADG